MSYLRKELPSDIGPCGGERLSRTELRGFHERGQPHPPSLVGRVLEERFYVEGIIGHGGTSLVYRGIERGTRRRVALKVPHRDQPDLLRYVEREARALRTLKHENIVEFVGSGRIDDERFLATEYLEGRLLGDLIGTNGLPWERARPLLLQICNAMQAAHDKGLLHTDIKPSNIFIIARPDGTELVKLFDFGFVKFLENGDDLERIPKPGLIIGTPAYIAPEQVLGDALDRRTDVYAFGALAYQLVCGIDPFNSIFTYETVMMHLHDTPRPPRELRPEISDAVERVVLRALEKEPARRFQTAEEIGTAIEVAA